MYQSMEYLPVSLKYAITLNGIKLEGKLYKIKKLQFGQQLFYEFALSCKQKGLDLNEDNLDLFSKALNSLLIQIKETLDHTFNYSAAIHLSFKNLKQNWIQAGFIPDFQKQSIKQLVCWLCNQLNQLHQSDSHLLLNKVLDFLLLIINIDFYYLEF